MKMTKDLLQQALSKSSLSYLNKISFMWMVISLIIFFIAHYLKIDKEACGICYSISNYFYFIEDFATASKFTDGMRLQWLFLFFSMPIFIAIVIYKINDLKHGELPLRLPLTFGLGLIFITLVFVFIDAPKESSFGFSYFLLNKNMIWSAFLSYVCFYGYSVCLIFTGLYLKAYIQNKGDEK